MQEITKGDPKVIEGLEKLCPEKGAVRHSTDFFGNNFYWFKLEVPGFALDAAKILHAAHARLAQIAAYNKHKDQQRMQSCCYEFVLDGTVYNVTANMDAEHDSVPSITNLFNNADWHEREMMELYGIKITGHPNPRRLFLDEELDKGLLGQMVPLSIVMNGASSTDLWERILGDKEAKS